MAGLRKDDPVPTEIKLHQRSRLMEVAFDDGQRFEFSFEFLRVFSPSAEVRGHGVGQEVLQLGKRDVDISASSRWATMPSARCFPTATTAACIRGITSTSSARTTTICGRPTCCASPTAGGSRDPADPPPAPRPAAAATTTEQPTSPPIMNDKTTHFGFQKVAESEKAGKVRGSPPSPAATT
jgi:hypothetical protein